MVTQKRLNFSNSGSLNLLTLSLVSCHQYGNIVRYSKEELPQISELIYFMQVHPLTRKLRHPESYYPKSAKIFNLSGYVFLFDLTLMLPINMAIL